MVHMKLPINKTPSPVYVQYHGVFVHHLSFAYSFLKKPPLNTFLFLCVFPCCHSIVGGEGCPLTHDVRLLG